MEYVAVILQVISTFLIASSGIVLSLARFKPGEVQYVQVMLAKRLTNCALASTIIAIIYGLGLITFGNINYFANLPPVPIEKAAAVNNSIIACTESTSSAVNAIAGISSSPSGVWSSMISTDCIL